MKPKAAGTPTEQGEVTTSDAIAEPVVRIVIPPPNYQIAVFDLIGTAPYVSNRFTKPAIDKLRGQQAEGTRARSRRTRDPKDFYGQGEQSRHMSPEGWFGQPATAYRRAMIDACRMVGFKMTHAKCSIFVLEDGYDHETATPLVRILGGDPIHCEHPVRNANGSCDLRARSMWRTWEVRLRVRFNADQFTVTDVANLLLHTGISIGIGAGRPFSTQSAGMGWGTFTLKNQAELAA